MTLLQSKYYVDVMDVWVLVMIVVDDADVFVDVLDSVEMCWMYVTRDSLWMTWWMQHRQAMRCITDLFA